MITHMLATDPGTPGDVLAWLAARPDLTATDALALATHERYPPDAPLTLHACGPDILRRALTNPALPAPLRATFIAATSGADLAATIAKYDCFTPQELTHAATRELPGDGYPAFAANTRTPRALAVRAGAAFEAHVKAGTAPSGMSQAGVRATLDATIIAHHLPATTPDTKAAAAHDDPQLAHALMLLEQGLSRGRDKARWWAETLRVNHHPALLEGALEYAQTLPQHAFSRVAGSITYAIALNTRAPLELRHLAADLSAMTGYDDLADTATPAALMDLDAPHTSYAIAWHSPNVTAQNLTALHATTRTRAARRRQLLTAIALHPTSPAELRTKAAANLPRMTATPHRELVLAVAAHAGHPSSALDVPYSSLLGAHDMPTEQLPSQLRHINYWTRAAWAHHSPPTPSIELARALYTVAGGAFPGTLRELIDTAVAIAT